MRLAFRTLAIVMPALFLASCDEMGWGDFERYKEDFHYSYKVKPGGRISLESFNGSVEIAGSAGDSVEINGTKYADTQQALKDLKIDIQQTGDSIRVQTVRPYGSHRGMGARYSIRVPKNFQLDRIVSSNGGIRVEDLQGPATLKSSNGGIRIYRLDGPLDATTSNGSVEMEQLTGNAIVHTSNGAIRGEVSKGQFEAETTNGSINVRLSDPSDQPVRLASSNGHIELAMNTVRDVRASTSNSSITLRLPSTPNARLRAHTSNSSITTEFDVNVHGTQSKNSLEGTLGSGGPLLDLNTSNGSIKITRL